MSGDILREARLRAGLTQTELGRRAGIPRQQIGRWERGEVLPSLETLRHLIRACGLELTFGLAARDVHDHDRALIDRSLALSPQERVDRALREARELYGLLAGAS